MSEPNPGRAGREEEPGPELDGPLFAGIALVERTLELQGKPLHLLMVQDPQAVMEQQAWAVESGGDVYWSSLWGSALTLTEMLLCGELPIRGPEVLELGCGLGLVSVASALAAPPGVSIRATDLEPRALALTRENARRNGCSERILTGLLDYRTGTAPPQHLVLVADCLYTPEAIPALLGFLERVLSPDPEASAVIVDPQRWTARRFRYQALEAGFEVHHERRKVPQLRATAALDPQNPPPTVQMGEGEVDVYQLSKSLTR